MVLQKATPIGAGKNRNRRRGGSFDGFVGAVRDMVTVGFAFALPTLRHSNILGC